LPEAEQTDTGLPWASPSAAPPAGPSGPTPAQVNGVPGGGAAVNGGPPGGGAQRGGAARPAPRRGGFRQRPIPLRPMSVLELIDGAVGAVPAVPRFLLLRAAAVVTGSAAAALALTWWFNHAVSSVVQANPTWTSLDMFGDPVTDYAPSNAEHIALITTEVLIAVVCSGFAATVLAGLFAPSVKAYVDAEPADPDEVRAILRGGSARLFGLAALTTLPRLIPTALFGLLTYDAAKNPGATIAGWYFLICLGCLPLCYWITAMTAVAAPAAALERARFGAALRRSRRLAARGTMRIGWTCLLTLLIVGAATAALDAFGGELRADFGVGDQFAGVPGSPGLSGWLLLYFLVYAVTLLITTPLRAATATLLYVDRRFRREGLDIRIGWARLANAGPARRAGQNQGANS
jgi:hypothetical protein